MPYWHLERSERDSLRILAPLRLCVEAYSQNSIDNRQAICASRSRTRSRLANSQRSLPKTSSVTVPS